MENELRIHDVEKAKCLILVKGSGCFVDMVVGRMAAFAASHNLEVLETLVNDRFEVEKLLYYIEREKILTVFVRNIKDISPDSEVLHELVETGLAHGVSFNEECRGYEPVRVLWDGDWDNQIVGEGEKGGLSYEIMDSETVVSDRNGKRIVACPTEEEAVTFIREQGAEHGQN